MVQIFWGMVLLAHYIFILSRFLTYSGNYWTGKSAACESANCTADCCAFSSDRKGYFIILQPEELEFAHNVGASTAHLKIIDDNFHGGKKAICTAADKSICDSGWKPFDCRMHPVFPVASPEGLFFYKYDATCNAFRNGRFAQHLENVARFLAGQFIEKPNLIGFCKNCLTYQDDFLGPEPFHDLRRLMQSPIGDRRGMRHTLEGSRYKL